MTVWTRRRVLGTAVAATLHWVTPAQLTQIAWTELNYRLGRLAARFEVAEGGGSFDEVAVFVSRFGCFAPAEEPLALAAVPASGRRAAEATQAELLDRAAALALGPGAGGWDLVRAIHEDPAATAPRIAATVWRAGLPFEAAGWRPFAG